MPRFHDIHCQDAAIALLRRALASGRSSHAYLFDGADGVGKELCARAFAARLLCEGATTADEIEACGTCRSCQLLERDAHPDFHFVHRGLHKLHPERTIRASKGLFLVVDVVRHFLITPAASSPTLGRRRVFVMRDAERMNEEAQNALLKTLEEPPGAAVLILVSSSASRLLPTIRSRCQRIPFRLLPTEFVVEQLKQAGADENEANALAGLAQGRLGLSLRWREMRLFELFQPVAAALEETRDPEAFAKSLLEVAEQVGSRAKGAKADEDSERESDDDNVDESDEAAAASMSSRKSRSSGKLSTDELRDAIRVTLSIIASQMRDGMLLAAGAAQLRAVPTGKSGKSGHDIAADEIAEQISAIATAESMLDRNVAPQLALERLAIAMGD